MKKIKIPKYKMVELYCKQKFSIRKIAKIFGCSRFPIHNLLIKYNIIRREGNYKKGKPKCNNCDKVISYTATRCQSCYLQILKKRLKANKKGKPCCIDCGKELSSYAKKIKRCKSCASKGENNPNYIHGKGREPYPLYFNNKLKEKIKQRDDYICQLCNITEEEHLIVFGIVLSVHHIDYDKANCDEDNLITLCQNCNLRANFNRKYWIKYFKKALISKEDKQWQQL